MYSFNSEKRLFAWADLTLKDWIKNNAVDYDDFADMLDDIDDVLPDVVDSGHVIEAFDSFMTTARDSAYIKGILDCVTSYKVCGRSITTTTGVNLMYRAVLNICFERNIDKYRLLWSECRRTC